ncbi:MAG: hypothetical protein LW705_05070, partial [Comamonadaceae bacterium]|nr:hypothetical protein [Comamonadaceae bacterium]
PTANLNTGNASIVVNAGSYTDAAGNVGAQGNSPSIAIDTLGMSVSSVSFQSDMADRNAEGTRIGAYVTFLEVPVIVTTGGFPTIDLLIGSTVVKATYDPTWQQNSMMMLFRYTILAGQTDTNGYGIVANTLTLNGGTIKDASGNNASLSHLERLTGGNIVDTTAPTLIITSNKTSLKSGETATHFGRYVEQLVNGFKSIGQNGHLHADGQPTTGQFVYCFECRRHSGLCLQCQLGCQFSACHSH